MKITTLVNKTILFATALTLANANHCSYVEDLSGEECDCCDSGTAVFGTCDVSTARHLDLCTGENSWMNDPTSYKLESKSIETKEWNLIQRGELIFYNRIMKQRRWIA